MKNLKLMAGLSMLAMLGACSSDAPEAPNANDLNGLDGKGMYISISLAEPTTTRAEDNNAKPGESVIHKLQVIILNADGTEYASFETDKSSYGKLDGKKAIFTVSNAIYTYMKNNASDLKILVYANNGDDVTAEGFLYGTTTYDPWGDNDNSVAGFLMTSEGIITGLEAAPTTDDGGKSETTAWNIKSDVNLVRLATRFDYTPVNSNAYKCQANKAVAMSVSGISPNTLSTTNTFNVPQFSADGKVAESGTTLDKAHVVQFAADATHKYRVTDANIIASGSRKSFLALTYGVTPTNPYGYARPNTISKAVEAATVAMFDRIPYAAVRAQFNVEGSASMTAHEPVFAINGVYIGGIADLKALGTTKFSIEYDKTTLTSTEQSDIDKVVNIVQDFITTNGFTEPTENTDAAKKAARENDEKRLASLGAEKYSYNSTLNGYFTYYAKFIQHGADNDELWWKYGVSRNTIYQIGVNSFKFLGNNGEGKPGEGPKPANVSDMWFDMTVNVVNWNLNDKNASWAF